VNLISSVKFRNTFQKGKSANLVNLSIAGCHNVDDEFASNIALLFPQIHMLSLAFVKGITDKGIEIILKNCSSLHYLDVFAMNDITGSSFSCIPQYAHKLNFLVIENYCDTEKKENLNALLKSNSKVQVHCTSTWKPGETYKCRLLQ